jgi:hypothetical protein
MEVVLVRRIGIVLGVATVMAAIVALTAGTALAQSETETFRIRDTIAFIWENPCTEEEILFEGDFQNVFHSTLNEKGYHNFSRGNAVGITGTGLETGDEYRFINAGGYTQNQLANGMFIDNNKAAQLLVSDGNSPNTILQVVTKATFDDVDREPFLIFDITTFGCTPEVETTQTRSD